jgi:hypothetical protein
MHALICVLTYPCANRKLKEFVRVTPAVFVVRIMALGKIDVSYVDQWVCMSTRCRLPKPWGVSQIR